MRKSLKRGAKLVKSLSSKALLTGIPRMSLSTNGATAYSPVQEEAPVTVQAPISEVPGSDITPAKQLAAPISELEVPGSGNGIIPAKQLVPGPGNGITPLAITQV